MSEKQTTTTTLATKSSEERALDYISKCKEGDYKELSRTPNKYIGDAITISGKVIQVHVSDDSIIMRIDINNISGNTILVVIAIDSSADRILEGDFITVWGEFMGETTYESTLGKKVTVPYMYVAYYQITEDPDTIVNTDNSGNKIVINDGIEITFMVNDITLTKVEKSYIHDGQEVVRIPVKIQNTTDETAALHAFNLNYFGSKGTQVESYTSYFDDGDIISNKLRPGAQNEGAIYIAYDGAGEYFVMLDNGYGKKETEVSIIVS